MHGAWELGPKGARGHSSTDAVKKCITKGIISPNKHSWTQAD